MVVLAAVAAMVNAFGVLLLGYAAIRVHKTVVDVKEAVHTSDGRTIGELVETSTYYAEAAVEEQENGK